MTRRIMVWLAAALISVAGCNQGGANLHPVATRLQPRKVWMCVSTAAPIRARGLPRASIV